MIGQRKCVLPTDEPDVELLLRPGLTLAQIAEPRRRAPRPRPRQVPRGGELRDHPVEVPARRGHVARGLPVPRHVLRSVRTETDEQIVQQARRSASTRSPTRSASRTRTRAHAVPDGGRRVADPDRGQARRGRAADLGGDPQPARATGMPLQIDSTLCYAKGGCPPVPTNADKAIDSPYNTYKISGLPPTPIASVTEASLRRRARTRPTCPYMYYVIADANGRHAFATTLAEHNAQRRGRVRGRRACCDSARARGATRGRRRSSAIRSRHSRSPAIHNAAFAALGLDWVFVAFPVPRRWRATRRSTAARARHRRRCTVTMPHKADAAAACDELTPTAAALGAVNTVVNRDGTSGRRLDRRRGLRRGRCASEGVDPAGHAVRRARRRRRRPGDRRSRSGTPGPRSRSRPARRDAAAAAPRSPPARRERVARRARGRASPGADVVVNATPLGMQGEAPPFDVGLLATPASSWSTPCTTRSRRRCSPRPRARACRCAERARHARAPGRARVRARAPGASRAARRDARRGRGRGR